MKIGKKNGKKICDGLASVIKYNNNKKKTKKQWYVFQIMIHTHKIK